MMDKIPRAWSFGLQFLSVGFYQLSRLHHCFGSQQTHRGTGVTGTGYPRFVFVLMIAFGFTCYVSWTICFSLVDTLTAKCGFRYDSTESEDQSIQFFWIYRERPILFDDDTSGSIYYHWSAITGTLFQLWDLITLMLYSYKMWKFGTFYKSQDDAVWKYIVSILHRIVIVTVFYQISCAFCGILYRLTKPLWNSDEHLASAVLVSVLSIILSFSMNLMMEHNTNEYMGFLYVLQRFKLNFCCCCCRHVVDEQLEELKLQELSSRNCNLPSESVVQSKETALPNMPVDVLQKNVGVTESRECPDTVTIAHVDHSQVAIVPVEEGIEEVK